MTSDFANTCRELKEIARRIDAFASEHGGDSGGAGTVAHRLATEPFRVLVIGEFSRGKSTFINALVGERLLPSSVRPTTAVISVIRNGPERRASVHWRDKSRAADHISLPSERADKALMLLTAKNEGAPSIARVEIELPIHSIQLPLEIVDTPGVNDIDTQREEITYGYLARADAAIMLLDLHQPISASEQRFLTEKVLAAHVKKLLFVVNKIDQESPDARERALTYVRSRLAAIGLGDALVLPVASKPALKAKSKGDSAALDESLFPPFERRLSAFLVEASGQSRVRTACLRIAQGLDGTVDTLESLVDGLQSERETLLDSIEQSKRRQRDLGREEHAVRTDMDLAIARYVDTTHGLIRQRLGAARAQVKACTSRPSFPSEADVTELRTVLEDAVKAVATIPGTQAEAIAGQLLHKHRLPAPSSQANALAAPLPSSGLDISMPEPDADPMVATIGAAVGAFVGTALLGPLGGVPLAVLGGWLGRNFGQKPKGDSVRTKALGTLATLDGQAQDALENASGQLRRRLRQELLEPRKAEIQREQHKQRSLEGVLAGDVADREKRIAMLNTDLAQAAQLRRHVMTLGGVA